MAGRQCHHCKEWVEDWSTHDCWVTTEAALTRDLSEDLQDAYERLRETAAAFGDQRIYASHHCIMFSRKACYCFVRPKRSVLEVVFFLGHVIKAPQVRRTVRPSRKKVAHIIHVRHRDEVEAPLTDWIQEAYECSDALSGRATPKPKPRPARRTPSPRPAARRQARSRDSHTAKGVRSTRK